MEHQQPSSLEQVTSSTPSGSTSAVPDIPGINVRPDVKRFVQDQISSIGIDAKRPYRGAQPVSFLKQHLDDLVHEDYFVCEKTDGVRALLYMTRGQNNEPQCYFIDRKNYYRYVPGLAFPTRVDAGRWEFHYKTLIDGELVLDIEKDGSRTLKFLAFDSLAINGTDVRNKPLTKRMGYLDSFVMKPYHQACRSSPEFARAQAFQVELKRMEFSYGVPKIFQDMQSLKHKSDGLIYTSVMAPYAAGTCKKMLKWKPAEENSIDFKLHIDTFPGLIGKPTFQLYVWKGGDEYEYYCDMAVTDHEWQELRNQQGSLEGRIVEVVYDPNHAPPNVWKLLRFRDDKPHGNHVSVLNSILESIQQAVTSQELIDKCPEIRTAWKQRPHVT
ncbi:Dcp1p-Dcp2p decapping enzyme complex alpha subunit [Spiromyces aspiralis]|uniref:Dcp1p-Dcp2p decapping enzyme complex alpha subunit n=1 Tax=Spiromyces aspiralis TaxID=68401 RepID=A0ACC1HWH5_9FUNG|nr:Dcp1p-Dcp2p decapping enzyme complex alpha subunit [Spiromyces aspiralis]